MRIFSHIGVSEDELCKKHATNNNDGLLVYYSANHPVELVINMPFIGQGQKSANAQGWLRDRAYYFRELSSQHPEYFSPENTELINDNKSPYVDVKLIQHFPQYKGYEGDRLIHHHIGEDGQSVALPSSIHKGYGEIHNVEKEIGVTSNAQKFSTEWQSGYINGESPTWNRFLENYSNEPSEKDGSYEQNKESVKSDSILPAKSDIIKVELDDSIENKDESKYTGQNEEHVLVDIKTSAEGAEQKEETAQTATKLNEEYTPAENKTRAKGYSPIGCAEKTAEAEPTENTQLNLGQASAEEEALAEISTPAEDTKHTIETTQAESDQLNKDQIPVEDEAPRKVNASAESTRHAAKAASKEATKPNEDYTPVEGKAQVEGNSSAEGTQLNAGLAHAEEEAPKESDRETVPAEETTSEGNSDKSQDAGEDNEQKFDYYSGYSY